jgi:hypothetical protein
MYRTKQMKYLYITAAVLLAYALAKDPEEKQPAGDPLPAHYPTKGKGKP